MKTRLHLFNIFVHSPEVRRNCVFKGFSNPIIGTPDDDTSLLGLSPKGNLFICHQRVARAPGEFRATRWGNGKRKIQLASLVNNAMTKRPARRPNLFGQAFWKEKTTLFRSGFIYRKGELSLFVSSLPAFSAGRPVGNGKKEAFIGDWVWNGTCREKSDGKRGRRPPYFPAAPLIKPYYLPVHATILRSFVGKKTK